MARTRGKKFVRGLVSKAVKYARLIISEKQERWLEDITGHPWTGRVWKERLEDD